MIRVHTNPIIFLLDNAEYVIEEQIHPGSYNKLQDWDYCALAHAMKGKNDNLWATKVGPRHLSATDSVSKSSPFQPVEPTSEVLVAQSCRIRLPLHWWPSYSQAFLNHCSALYLFAVA